MEELVALAASLGASIMHVREVTDHMDGVHRPGFPDRFGELMLPAGSFDRMRERLEKLALPGPRLDFFPSATLRTWLDAAGAGHEAMVRER